MKNIFKAVIACLIGTAAVSQDANAWSMFGGPVSGEIGIKATGYDTDTGKLYRFNEFKTLPRDGSLSIFDMQYLSSSDSTKAILSTSNIAEDDVEGELYLNYKNYLTFSAGYEKTPHQLDLANAYYTERVAENYKLSILPLSKIHGILTWGVEDKTGRKSATGFVGQKSENRSLELVGEAGMARILLGLGQEELNERYRAHGSDEMSVSVSLAPSANTFGILSYNEKEYDLDMAVRSSTIERENTDLSALFTLTNNLYIASTFSNRQRSNTTAGSLSFEDNYFMTNIGYRSSMGKLGLTYKMVNRDYSGTGVDSLDTESLQIKGSTRFSIIGLKANYVHGYRDMAGVNNANLINYEELNSEFGRSEIEVSLLGFKKFALAYHLKRNYRKNTIYATYGTSSNQSVDEGFSSHYIADEDLMLYMNYYELENRMQGRQLFIRNGRVLDSTYQIYDDTDYFQIGGVYSYARATDLKFDYFYAQSDLLDPHDSNRILEKVLSLKLEHEITRTHSVNTGFTWNSYEDGLDGSVSRGNCMYEIEFLRKF